MQLPEDATLEQAAALAQNVPAAVATGSGPLQVDASQLKSFDSSTLALLLHTHRLAQAAGRSLVVSGAPAQLAQLAQLYGVEALLGLTPPAAAAEPGSAHATQALSG